MENQTIIPENSQLKTSEIAKLFNMASTDKDGLYQALTEAYLMGYKRGVEHSTNQSNLDKE